MDAEPQGFEEDRAYGRQAFQEGGRGGGRVLARTGPAQALPLLHVRRPRGAQMAGRATDAVRGGVAEPDGFEELRPGVGEAGVERRLCA
ncbi:hypothetical protein Slala05_00780 [Streptomyces lavendulae subsp. lavendulae]|nr:hypothetical protein Slala05_00780 [Streptomyces lavendulae subsp. lavendulae]